MSFFFLRSYDGELEGQMLEPLTVHGMVCLYYNIEI